MFEIITPDQMRAAEKHAVRSGEDSFALMRAAGKAVAATFEEVFAEEAYRSVLVLCGPGNNGGDGFVAAAELEEKGWDVRVVCMLPPDRLKGDAGRAARMWTHPVLPLPEADPQDGEIVIDALFGTGFSGALPPQAVEIFEKIRQRNVMLVAIDVPSGLDAATGAVDPATPDAAMTVTFFRKKIGHVLMPGLGRCGGIVLRDIGIPDEAIESGPLTPRENDPDLWRSFLNLNDQRPGGGSKYDRGHAVILAGPRMTGAAMMATHAACRAGVGLCTLVGFPHLQPWHANVMGETIERFGDFAETLADPRRNLVLIGPGAGQDDPEGLRRAVRAAISDRKRRVVLDADALNVFAADPSALFSGLNADAPRAVETAGDSHLAGLHAGCVLTPHAGEFARLFPSLNAGDKIARARGAAFLSGAVVVFKGPDTVIAAPDGRVVVNTHASPDLATGGSGDVLAGLILGFMGRGMSKGIDTFSAACAAAWVQGEAALRFGPGLMATDLPEMVPAILSDLQTKGR